MRILGVDPGTGICGFGVIEIKERVKGGRKYREPAKMIDAGVISTPAHTPRGDRVLDIYESMHEIIETNKPDVMAIEKLYFVQNITTGISVAEARGVILLVAKQCQLPVYGYNPTQIKKALTGYGQAKKPQIQEMVKMQLGLNFIPKPDDAADALAAAITYMLMEKQE